MKTIKTKSIPTKSAQEGSKKYLDSKIGRFNKDLGAATIYVGNLNYAMTEKQIKNLFEVYGVVSYVKVVKDEQTHKSTGIAFVQMLNRKHASFAISKINGSEVEGRTLKVSIAEEKEDKRIKKKKKKSSKPPYISKADRLK
ncbi:MAG: hypothetical protein KBD63_07755 [Bacteriovoracaceae bacterium]|nr:hypothetical protein [Bacteriovoracaceae bacterium]